ncbi:MAG: DUF2283 domain-containing protein [Chloroflexia bacterium]|nr:DUF2283 domain-containing protein [Chloroflexia bacterium]
MTEDSKSKDVSMKITRDGQTGAMYIAISEVDVARTVEIESINGHIFADVDDQGAVLGVEIICRTGSLDIEIPERITVEQPA